MEMKTARRRRTTSKKGASKTGTPTWKQAAQKEEEGAKKRIGLPPLAVMDKTELPTVSQLRDIIPKHCFQRSSLHSLALVVRDGLIIFALGYIAWHYLPTIPVDNSWSTWATWFFSWSMYWYWQGAAMTGWWVLAHECGHRGFSESTLLCDVVGFILHSFLLVPYFSWQYSHAKHHAKTSHLSDGETHIASIKKDSTRDRWMHAVLGDDAFAVVEILLLLTIGWPIYLFTGITGARRDPEGKPLEAGKLRDHFRPSSALFPKTGAWDARVMASNAGLVLNLYAICHRRIFRTTIEGGDDVFPGLPLGQHVAGLVHMVAPCIHGSTAAWRWRMVLGSRCIVYNRSTVPISYRLDAPSYWKHACRSPLVQQYAMLSCSRGHRSLEEIFRAERIVQLRPTRYYSRNLGNCT